MDDCEHRNIERDQSDGEFYCADCFITWGDDLIGDLLLFIGKKDEQNAQLQARLESEEAHYARLYCKNQEINAAALALANVCRSEWDEFADIETVEVVIEYELVENLLNALR